MVGLWEGSRCLVPRGAPNPSYLPSCFLCLHMFCCRYSHFLYFKVARILQRFALWERCDRPMPLRVLGLSCVADLCTQGPPR